LQTKSSSVTGVFCLQKVLAFDNFADEQQNYSKAIDQSCNQCFLRV
jgi:hypothetical protein